MIEPVTAPCGESPGRGQAAAQGNEVGKAQNRSREGETGARMASGEELVKPVSRCKAVGERTSLSPPSTPLGGGSVLHSRPGNPGTRRFHRRRLGVTKVGTHGPTCRGPFGGTRDRAHPCLCKHQGWEWTEHISLWLYLCKFRKSERIRKNVIRELDHILFTICLPGWLHLWSKPHSEKNKSLSFGP